MSGMRAFDSATTLTVSEGYDLTNQQHYSQRRCRCSCNFLFKRCTFRLWQILLFLFIVALIIALLLLLVAMFGPGNTDLKYSARSGTEAPDDGGDETEMSTKAPTEASATTKEGVRTTEQQPSPKPTTAPQTTVKQTTPAPQTTPATAPQTTGQTSAGPSTGAPTSTNPPLTTAEPTTAAPTTTGPPPTTIPSGKTPLECDVAIVGGGTSGLLMANVLLQSKKETNVCIFEREDRLGGKILDYRFSQAPDIVVGLGEWNYKGDNTGAELDFKIYLHLDNETDRWVTKTSRVEARGVYADSFDSLKSKAFPTLLYQAQMNNKTLAETAKYVVDAGTNYRPFSTADTFLSNKLSPEGAELMENAYRFKGDYMQKINPFSYRKYLEKELHVFLQSSDDSRPFKGMSEIITILEQKVKSNGGKIYLKETVVSIDKRGDGFVIQTTNFTVKANKTVLTPGPGALKKIKGDVIQNITDHEIFKSIVSVPAFHGAAVYKDAWWNDTTAAQKNNTLQPLDMFISTSNCLGITMPYQGVGPNGTAVLHTIANNGGCSDKWGEILSLSPDEVDKELKRALKYKFQRDDIPDPLETKYKYWNEGFWFLQKPGADFNLTAIQQWAKRPLTGQDVFLVHRAFNNFGGYLEYDILSTKEALLEGWKLPLPF